MAIPCEMPETKQTMGFRSLADLQKAKTGRQSDNSALLAQHSASFRSLAELEKAFLQRHDVYSLLLTEHAQTLAMAVNTESSMTGCLDKVFPSQGYGFIAPEDGSKSVFLHFRDIANGTAQDLLLGTQLRFTLLIDEHGKRKAKNATLIELQEAENCSTAEWDSACRRYSRRKLLSIFQALQKANTTPPSVLPKLESITQSKESDYALEKTLKAKLKLEAKILESSTTSGDSTPTAAGDSASDGECVCLGVPM